MGATEPLRIKGVDVGSGAPKTIVPLLGANEEALMAEARAAVSAGADCVEWRADLFAGLHDAEGLVHAARALAGVLPHTPLIATIRTKAQGGLADVEPDEYARLVAALATQGAPDVVDVELCCGSDAVRELVGVARAAGVHTIVSHHDFCGTPEVERMVGLLSRMAELGASIPKLAVMARSRLDTLRLMEATTLAADKIPNPLLTIAMGAAGVASRLCGETFGSALTFCALGSASAPGQVELAQARAVLSALHGAVGQARADGCRA